MRYRLEKNFNSYTFMIVRNISEFDTILNESLMKNWIQNFKEIVILYSRKENLKYSILNDKNLQLTSKQFILSYFINQ
jgi:hypothetical protein